MENINYSVSHFLKAHLEKVQERNSSFSLRAMAAKVSMSPGGLAQIMNGKKKISMKRAVEVAENLKLSKKNKELFLKLAELEQTDSMTRKSELVDKLKQLDKKSQFFNLEVENFKLLSKWHGFAILECVSSYGANWSDKEIASHFSLKLNDVKLTLERLISLELVERDMSGSWSRIKDRVIGNFHHSNEAIKSHYQSCHKKSLDSIQEQSSEKRITGTEYFAIHKDDLDEIRNLTYEYLDKLQDIANKRKDPNITYQALVNIFNLTK